MIFIINVQESFKMSTTLFAFLTQIDIICNLFVMITTFELRYLWIREYKLQITWRWILFSFSFGSGQMDDRMYIFSRMLS